MFCTPQSDNESSENETRDENDEESKLRKFAADVQELSSMLDSITFVDYFNIFLCLPVFGQQVFYKFASAEFEFEPPIPNERCLFLDRRVLLNWLCAERFHLFQNCPMYTEYKLCIELQKAKFDLPGITDQEDVASKENLSIFIKNILGTAIGMLLFRESLRGTCGEMVYRCWRDIEAWRRIQDPVRRIYWKDVIKTRYISQITSSHAKHTVRPMVYGGMLNFDIYPESDSLYESQGKHMSQHMFVSNKQSSTEALLKLQAILLNALKMYWLPRYLIHIIKVSPMETLEVFKKSSNTNKKWSALPHVILPIIEQKKVEKSKLIMFTSKSVDNIQQSSKEELMSSEIKITHQDLLSLCGGPAKEFVFRNRRLSSAVRSSVPHVLPSFKSSSGISCHSLESNRMSLPDLNKLNKLESKHDVASAVNSTIPSVLTWFLGGNQLTQIEQFSKITNRIVWFLASDLLACFPFRSYLKRNEQMMDLHCLSFWSDVRNYLDTDDDSFDYFGHSLKHTLAHRIVETYLSKEGIASGIFPHEFNKSLFDALIGSNDISLLYSAQKIVQNRLWQPIKSYMEDERRRFLEQLTGLQDHKSDKMDRTLKLSEITKSTTKVSHYVNHKSVHINSKSVPMSSSSHWLFSHSIPPFKTLHPPRISKEQTRKAMELVILCTEYGSSMIVPQYLPTLQLMGDGLQNEYGSLYEPKEPFMKHKWVKSLIKKSKINIETIKVSRKVIEETFDWSQLRQLSLNEKAPVVQYRKRRAAAQMDRPPKPRSFIEVLKTPKQFAYFKQFLAIQKADLSLMFWKTVETIKKMNVKDRNRKIKQTVRTFFGKHGLQLFYDEEILQQIPQMPNVTLGTLMLAQAVIYKNLEKKWFAYYIDTFPPDTEVDELEEQKRLASNRDERSKKLLQLLAMRAKWQIITHALSDFNNTIMGRHGHLFDFFLTYEVEREVHMHRNIGMSYNQPIEKNIISSEVDDQVRVILNNKLITLNRIPADLRFWREIRCYQELFDAQKDKNKFDWFTEFLIQKAKCIIQCYLDSELPPKVQVNITTEVATKIVHQLIITGPTRGLFHEAVIALFPLLYHYFLRYNEAIATTDIAEQYVKYMLRDFKDNDDWFLDMADMENKITDKIGCVHPMFWTGVIFAVLFRLDPLQGFRHFKEDMLTIHYTIAEGITYIHPYEKPSKKQASKRMSSQSPTDVRCPIDGSLPMQNLDMYQSDTSNSLFPPINKDGLLSESDPNKHLSSVLDAQMGQRHISNLLNKINKDKEEFLSERNKRKRSLANVVGKIFVHSEKQKHKEVNENKSDSNISEHTKKNFKHKHDKLDGKISHTRF